MKKVFAVFFLTLAIILLPVSNISANGAWNENIYDFQFTASDQWDSTDFRGKADYYIVVNCREWITLRERPSVYGEDLAHIPLGTKVLVSDVPARNGFLPVVYKGIRGYCLEQYLKFAHMS